MLEVVEGIIVSETSYGETSKIINVYTKKYGIIGMMAKGAKTMKSPFRSTTLKFTYANFHIMYKPNKLSILKSVDLLKYFKNINSDLTLISYLTYITDLTVQVFKESNSSKIYDLYITAINKLEDSLDPLIITNILEIKYLDYLGVGINLTECAICSDQKSIVTLDASLGGLVCKNCFRNSKVIDLKVVKLLRMYYLVDIKSIGEIKIDKHLAKEIDNFLKIYYESYTGLYIKSKDFLKKIANL